MVVIACVEIMIEFELVKAERDRPKKRSVGRPSLHWMEDGATSPMSSFKGTKFDPLDPEPKAAPSIYEDLVESKSPLVEDLTEEEFYDSHSYNSDLQSWIREPKGKDDLTSYIGQAEDRRTLQLLLQKVSSGGFDNEDELTQEEWEAMQEHMGQMTPEEMQEFLSEINQPTVSWEDIPEQNRPDISAFKDAFSDDEEPPVTKSLDLFKEWLEKDDGFLDWLKRKTGWDKEDIPQGDELEAERQAKIEELKSRDPAKWEERWEPGWPWPSPRWYKTGFKSHQEWQDAGSPEPKPRQYNPKPKIRLSPEELERRKKEREYTRYMDTSIHPNLRMDEIEERPDSKSELERLKRERSNLRMRDIEDKPPSEADLARNQRRIAREAQEARKAELADSYARWEDSYYKPSNLRMSDIEERPDKKSPADEKKSQKRRQGYRESKARNRAEFLRRRPATLEDATPAERKALDDAAWQRLKDQAAKESRAMKRREGFKIPPKNPEARAEQDAIARLRDTVSRGRSYMPSEGGPSLESLLHERDQFETRGGPVHETPRHPIRGDYVVPGSRLPKRTTAEIESEKKPYKDRLARLMKPVVRNPDLDQYYGED